MRYRNQSVFMYISAACSQNADMVFVLDSSGSIEKGNWDIMLKFVVKLIQAFTIGEDDVHVGIVRFSDTADISFRLDDYENDIIGTVKGIEYSAGGTDTAEGISTMAMRVFDPTNSGLRGDRPDVSNIAIVVTDGESNNQQATINAASEAKQNGIVMLAVGITDSINEEELSAISSSGIKGDNYWTSPDFKIARQIRKNLVRTACRNILSKKIIILFVCFIFSFVA